MAFLGPIPSILVEAILTCSGSSDKSSYRRGSI